MADRYETIIYLIGASPWRNAGNVWGVGVAGALHCPFWERIVGKWGPSVTVSAKPLHSYRVVLRWHITVTKLNNTL